MIRKSGKEQMIQLQTSRGFVMALTQTVGAQTDHKRVCISNRTYLAWVIFAALGKPVVPEV